VQFSVGEVEAFEHGEVGWAAARLTITKPDGGAVSPRWTSVLQKVNGRWTFVQTHASIAVLTPTSAGSTTDRRRRRTRESRLARHVPASLSSPLPGSPSTASVARSASADVTAFSGAGETRHTKGCPCAVSPDA
jgi:hypothetical protein